MVGKIMNRGSFVFAGAAMAGLAFGLPAKAQGEEFPDNISVIGAGCFGFDCELVNPNSDQIWLRKDVLGVSFDDTSTAAGFPANDWRIVINDEGSGGSSYFAIVDATAGQTLFRICAVADTNCTNIMPSGASGADPQTAVNTSDIAAINTQLGGFADQISANRDGVAMAIALGGIAPLLPDQNGTLAFNVGHFNGANAFGLAGGFRLNDGLVLNTGLGYASGSRTVGGRLGLQYSW